MNDTKAIKEALHVRMEDVCRQLLPSGKLEGGLWVARNPRFSEGRKKAALKVRVHGGDIGAWSDWRSGDKGDSFMLISHCLDCDFKTAIDWVRDFLGLRNASRQDWARMRTNARKAEHDNAQRADKLRGEKIKKAQKLFNNNTDAPKLLVRNNQFKDGWGKPETLAINYFSARQCALQKIKFLATHSFRFSGATEHWRSAVWQQEGDRRIKTQRGTDFPAIHSAMRAQTGVITACHVTFLDPIRPAKAPVEQAKLMFGIAKGAIIEVSMGRENKPFWQSEDPRPVILAEGIETAATLAVALEDMRVWACGSLSGIGHAPVSIACVSEIYFARDNNDGNQQAQKQFDGAVELLEQSEKPVAVMASHVGDDFNDLAKGEDDGDDDGEE